MDTTSSKPLITTIIPTYRRPILLKRAIRSVLNQTYPHFQVCIYDNASGDETAKVVGELAQKELRVKYHCHSENIGALANFNYGMAHVNTPFFSFLSDDDILLPEYYEIALAGFEKYPESMFSATEVIYIAENGKVRGTSNDKWKPGYYQSPEGLLSMLNYGHPPTWTGVLYRREVIEEVGILDGAVGGQTDYDFEQRIAARFPFVLSKEPGAIFVYHPLSWTTSDLNFVWPSWLKMIRNITDDEQIPLSVRDRAGYLLTEELKQKIKHYGLKAIKTGDFNLAYKAADLLSGYGMKREARMLRLLARISDLVPGGWDALRVLSRIHCSYMERGSTTSTSQYEEYSKYLTMVW